MKKVIFFPVLLLCMTVFSQDMTKFKLYKPAENAEAGIAAAVKLAKSQGKHVFIQIGGNWCIWCARFNDYVNNDKQIDSLIRADYIVYHLNYSKENYNAKLLAKFSFPQRFGFPVFLILDAEGILRHSQNSWYLEDGAKSYDREKVVAFFKDWRPQALDAKQYEEQ